MGTRFGRFYTESHQLGKGGPNARDVAVMAATEADVPLIGSAAGGVSVRLALSGEESPRHVREARPYRQVDTTTAFEARRGIREATDAVREDLPFRDPAAHTPGGEASWPG